MIQEYLLEEMFEDMINDVIMARINLPLRLSDVNEYQ